MTFIAARLFLAVLTVLTASLTSGCTRYILTSGVSGPRALSNYKSRADVNEQFGKPADTRTCPDGRVVENRWIRQRLWSPPGLSPFQKAALVMVYPALFFEDMSGALDAAYRSEKAKLHYAFVYDEADRLLYVYDLGVSDPGQQFLEAKRDLDSLLNFKLREEECDTWTVCITEYVQEARRRAACIGYAPGADCEQNFERLFAIGDGVDSEKIPREIGLTLIGEMLCLPPSVE